MIRRWIRNFFGFSRSQINAFIILLPLMIVIVFSEPVYRWFIVHRAIEEDHRELDSLAARWERGLIHSAPAKNGTATVAKNEKFSFDPNTLSQQKFEALGFTPKLALRIVHYRQKGGKFKIKSDLLKMYGMDSTFYETLIPFINLPGKKAETPHAAKSFKDNIEQKKFARFDLNQADTAQLRTIFGIGEKRSLRIIAYREKLGGFISQDQIGEIYTLDTAVVKALTRASFIGENFVPRKLLINSATEFELAAHPYLSKTAARQIVAYRFQHGKFQSTDDLRKIQTLDPKIIEKIASYLSFEISP
jgi:DNA uptake protein ComE-like DNA-binding protein